MGVESGGGHNVTQGNIGDINNRTGDLAQGYYQITGATWSDFGGGSTGYNSAKAAPYASQLQIAQNIPVARWGPNTQAQLAQNGYVARPGETLGAMLQRYGEDPAATVPADGSSPVGGGAILASGPADASSGLPAGSSGGVPIDPSTGMPATLTDTAGNAAGGSKEGEGTKLNVGIQKSLIGEIGGWINEIATGVWQGAWKSISSTFLAIQNWFIRAFVILVGLVILAIGLMKITGTDEKLMAFAKARVGMAA